MLSRARVLVIGAGALGSIAASYLCAAGVGGITVADFDTIDISNLQRQIMYQTADAGSRKCEILTERLRQLNPEVNVTPLRQLIRRDEAAELFPGFDFIIDGTDNPETKFTVSRICHELGKPCTIGGVEAMHGQIATYIPGSTPFFEIVGEAISGGMTPCAAAGVLGPAAGVVASLLAAEAIKYITGAGQLLTDRLLLLDVGAMNFTTLRV